MDNRGELGIMVGYSISHPQGTYHIMNLKTKKLSLMRDILWLGKLYGDFEEDVFEEPNITLENTTRTKYFKDLSSVFYGGNEEEFAKQFESAVAERIVVLTNDLVNQEMQFLPF